MRPRLSNVGVMTTFLNWKKQAGTFVPLRHAVWVCEKLEPNPEPSLECARVTFNIARRHQFVITQPVVIFFSAAYFAAASLTMGAITESSAVIQSDEIFHFLPSQVWMRPVRVPS